MQPLPTTHAVIPASVRYDLALTPAARLLYGEITALCAQRGYCWATNDYFARLYQVRRATISAWIQQLTERGHLVATINQAQGNRRQLRPAPEAGTTSSAFPHALASETAPPVPPGRTTYPEISFTEMEALLLGKKNDTGECEASATPTSGGEVNVELGPDGAVPPPIPPVAPPPLPMPPASTSGRAATGFVRPTPAQVIEFFTAQPEVSPVTATAEATRFFNYYQANGWRVGRHAMADWPAAARNWLLNADRFKTTGVAAGTTPRLHSGGTKNYSEPL